MSSKEKPGWFFWLVAGYTALQLAWLALCVFDFVTHPLSPDPLSETVVFRWLLMGLALPAALVVALLVLRRTPGNVTGLCLLLGVVLIGGLTLRAASPLRAYAGLNASWTGLWLLGLYFPDGKPQPARAAGLLRGLSAASLISNATLTFFDPTLNLGGGVTAPNPLFVPALAPWQGVATALQQGLLLAVALSIVPSLVWRYRVSDARGRLQLKWLAWAFGLLLLLVLPLWITALAAGRSDPFERLARWPLLGVTLYILVFPFVAVGNAILRHRLYDIDVIIRRTLIYSVLTAILAVAYFGSVLLLESVFRALTGQGQNTLVVVLSTLGIAALFGPVRSRVQRAIDRRFYRRKYDAARTLAGFGASVRDETNLDDLTERLVSVVDETLRPASVSLWLPESKR